MKKISKFLGLSALSSILVLSLGIGTALAATTYAVNAITETGALTIDGAAGSALTLGDAATTGNIVIGGGQTSGTITVGAASGQTGNVVVYGGITGGANSLFNNSTTSTIAIGGALTTGTLTLGNASGTGAVVLNGGTNAANTIFANVTTGSITNGAGLTSGTYTLGNSSQTGNVVINGGITGGANTLFNNVTTSTIAAGAGLTTGTLTLGGTSQTGVTTVNSAAVTTPAVNVSDTALTTGTDLLVTGSAPATMTNTGSFIRVNDGTSNVFRVGINGHITSVQATAPAAGGTCTTPAVAAGSTDFRGQVSSASCTSGQTMTATFNKAYATAPFCTVSPANTAAAVTASAGAVTYASASATVLTVTSPAVSTTGGAWNYICVE